MAKTIIYLALFAFMAINSRSENPSNFNEDTIKLARVAQVENKKPHVQITHEDGTTWKLWYIAVGTRSEGMHGRLDDSHGLEIQGTKIGETKSVHGVVYEWKGKQGNAKQLFDHTGWIPKRLEPYASFRNFFQPDYISGLKHER